MKVRNEFFIVDELKWERDKISRIEVALHNRYSNNVIFHKDGMGDLESELMRFPYGVTDDIIDAEQGLVRMLSKGAKTPKKAHAPEDDLFERLRNSKLPQNNKPKSMGHFLFGRNKGKNYKIPTKKTWE